MVDATSRTQPTIQVNRHRLRQNRHGPDIHFDWSTNPSPFHLSGKKNKIRPRGKVSTNPPERSGAPGIAQNIVQSTDTHGTSIRALGYNEVATEQGQPNANLTECSYCGSVHRPPDMSIRGTATHRRNALSYTLLGLNLAIDYWSRSSHSLCFQKNVLDLDQKQKRRDHCLLCWTDDWQFASGRSQLWLTHRYSRYSRISKFWKNDEIFSFFDLI